MLGRRSDIYWGALNPDAAVDPRAFGNDPDLSASAVAKAGLMDSNFLHTFSGC